MSSSADIFGQLFGFLCLGGFVLIFVGIGIYLIIRSRKDKQKAVQSLGWPVVSGKVLESRLLESTSTDSDGDTSTTYRPYVRYEYEKDGALYTGDKIKVGMVVSTSGTKKAQETLQRFPAGTTVRVYVNPNDPTDAVLEQNASTTPTLIIGVVLLAAGLCLVLPIGLILLLSIASTGQ